MGENSTYFYELFLLAIFGNTDKFGWKKGARTVKSKQWTKKMTEIMKEIAKEYGEIETEVNIVGNERFDYFINGDDLGIFIEHENATIDEQLDRKTKKWKKGHNEVAKLSRMNQELSVFITYAKPEEFPCNYFADKILDDLIKRKFKNEFLLIIGSEEMLSPNDWIGYIITASDKKKEFWWKPSTIEMIPRYTDYQKLNNKNKKKRKTSSSVSISSGLDDTFQDWVNKEVYRMNKKKRKSK